jgi:methyltransferase
MKVLLIYPPNPSYCVLNEDFSLCEPLGLEYIAAGLEADHDVEIVDMRLEPDLEAKLGAQRFDVIALSVPFTTSINQCNDVLRRAHKVQPTAIRILGGHYPSTSLQKIALRYVDYVVSGEGVFSTRELLAAIADKSDARDIAGIITVVGGMPQKHRALERLEIESCPTPARHLLDRYRKRYFHAHYDPVALMRFSIGCPFNCSFCILWKMTDRKYITRSSDSILREMSGIESPNIYVVDDEAFIQIPRMSMLAEEIIRSGFNKRFHMYVRSDTVARSPAVFEKWGQAGLDSVLVGLESIFADELAEYSKKISLELARECVRILHSNGIEIRANFIIKPDYTVEKFRRVREVIEELEIDRPTFAVLTPFIGTDTYEQLRDELILDEPEFYDCYHALTRTRLPLRTFYAEFAGLFRAAQQRGLSNGPESDKVFYAGKGDTFENFVSKIEGSDRYYRPNIHGHDGLA